MTITSPKSFVFINVLSSRSNLYDSLIHSWVFPLSCLQCEITILFKHQNCKVEREVKDTLTAMKSEMIVEMKH